MSSPPLHAGAASRRNFLRLVAPSILLGVAGLGTGRALARSRPAVVMYKNAECGCCEKWSRYLRARDFTVNVLTLDDLAPVKLDAGVPENLASCHTAFVDGYVVEGHVPLPAIEKMLREQPDFLGIAVAGMPAGSPGMPGLDIEPHEAVAFAANGAQSVYMSF